MGSAFTGDDLHSPETVLMRTWDIDDDGLVVHDVHPECVIQEPHRMSECGRFDDLEQTSEETPHD